MTRDTLIFLRTVCDRLTLTVADPDFRTLAHQMITALDELDKEIADANNTIRQHPTGTGNTGRASISDLPRLNT